MLVKRFTSHDKDAVIISEANGYFCAVRVGQEHPFWKKRIGERVEGEQLRKILGDSPDIGSYLRCVYADESVEGEPPNNGWWFGFYSSLETPEQELIDRVVKLARDLTNVQEFPDLMTLQTWLREQRDFGYDRAELEPYLYWFMIANRHRDSDRLERSNWDAIETELGGEGEHCAIFRFGHWAVGWMEIMVTDLAADANRILSALRDYPVLDDSSYFDLEYDEMLEAWSSYGADDLLREIMPEDFETDNLIEDWQLVLFKHTDWESDGDDAFNFYISDDFDFEILCQKISEGNES